MHSGNLNLWWSQAHGLTQVFLHSSKTCGMFPCTIHSHSSTSHASWPIPAWSSLRNAVDIRHGHDDSLRIQRELGVQGGCSDSEGLSSMMQDLQVHSSVFTALFVSFLSLALSLSLSLFVTCFQLSHQVDELRICSRLPGFWIS